MSRKYAKDKPKYCRYCCFWKGKKKGCMFGGEENCYYILPEEEEKKSRCQGCPYAKDHPCIGFCLISISNRKKQDAGK